MIGSFNVLGLIYNGRKVFLAIGVLGFLFGLFYKAKGYYHDWHTKPLFELRRELNQSRVDLNSSRERLKLCENSKAVEVFVTENSSVFNNYREKIEEMENEELDVSSSDVNYDWMYK